MYFGGDFAAIRLSRPTHYEQIATTSPIMVNDVFSEISVLIPGYSIEDLPTDLQEDDAASLLNAIACAWHPALLSYSGSIPILRQAESLTGYPGRRVVLVPSVSESWMPHEWRKILRDQQHIVIDKCTNRDEWLRAIAAASSEFAAPANTTGVDNEVAPESTPAEIRQPILVDHFLSLGIVILQVSLLSRRRHHYVDPDTMLLNTEIHLAADASMQGDEETCRRHLQRCFEHLRETRERFFPMDCYLVDFCLPSEQEPTESIDSLLTQTTPLNLFATGQELARWVEQSPQIAEQLRSGIEQDRICLLTGHDTETRSSLGSMATAVADLKRCQQVVRNIVGDVPRHWTRRRFGLLASLPTVLAHFGFESAMHVALDDGLYPDREKTQLEWKAADGSSLAATSRIPVAIDSASGFLKFADRYNESMQDDTTAALFLARLPTLKSPWLHDLQIAASHAPVLGSFATMAKLVHVSSGSRLAEEHDHADYLSPFLIQSSVLKTEAPISGPATLRQLNARLDALRNAFAIVVLAKAPVDSTAVIDDIERVDRQIAQLEVRHVDVTSSGADHVKLLAEEARTIGERLSSIESQLCSAFQQRVPTTSNDGRGLLILNPLPFGRIVSLIWPTEWRSPASSALIELLQENGTDRRMLVKLPPGGFVWLTEASNASTAQSPLQRIASEPPLAESLTLRNRHFEVTLSGRTGGIESVAFHGKRGNRMAQQVCFRYERDQTLPDDGSGEVRKTPYAVPRLVDHRVIESGTVFASIETTTELLSPVDQSVLAVAKQVISLDRASMRFGLRVTFENIRNNVKGNPWLTYFGCRFAWDSEVASVTRAVMGQAAGFRSERFESPDYVEISDEQQRALICSLGRAYHRRSGPRMLDSLLIVEGEPQRSFEFVIEFDQIYPLRTAADIISPPFMHQTTGQKPSLESSWILGLSARNVELVRADARPATPEAAAELRLLLLETEGGSGQCIIRTAAKPLAAFTVSGDGRDKFALQITDQGVVVPMNRWQIREVLIVF